MPRTSTGVYMPSGSESALTVIGEAIPAAIQAYQQQRLYEAQLADRDEARKFRQMEFEAKQSAREADREFQEQAYRDKMRQQGFLRDEESGELKFSAESPYAQRKRFEASLQNRGMGDILKKLEIEDRLAKRERERAQPNLTPAQKKVDQEFAKTYQDWSAAGGFSNVQKNLNQLRSIANELEKAKKSKTGLTGPETGLIPEILDPLIQPKLTALQDRVRDVVFQSLRDTLGAQFTEREGQRLVEASFNPKLSEEENIERLQNTIAKIEQMAAAKQAASNYYEQKGTLQGFQGPQINLGQNIAQGQMRGGRMSRGLLGPEQSQAAPKMTEEDIQALEWARQNPTDKRAKQIFMKLGQ